MSKSMQWLLPVLPNLPQFAEEKTVFDQVRKNNPRFEHQAPT